MFNFLHRQSTKTRACCKIFPLFFRRNTLSRRYCKIDTIFIQRSSHLWWKGGQALQSESVQPPEIRSRGRFTGVYEQARTDRTVVGTMATWLAYGCRHLYTQLLAERSPKTATKPLPQDGTDGSLCREKLECGVPFISWIA